MPSPPISMDPSKSGGTNTTFHLPAYGTLLHDQTLGQPPVPSLAESYTWLGSGPQVTLQVKLRSGLMFSDGTALDSAAVKTSIEHFKSGGGSFSSTAAVIASIDTPDPLTVVFNLSKPNTNFLYGLSDGTTTGMGEIISPTALAGNLDALGTTTDGAGPYMLSSTGTVQGSEYHYLPNPHYYDPSGIKYKEVVIKVIADSNTALASLQSGQIDVANGSTDTYQSAQSSGVKAEVYNTNISGLWISDWNGKDAPALADPRVRQAINMAVDRTSIANAATNGLGKATAQTVPVDALGYDASLDSTYSYDQDGAKKLLATAGYANGFTMSVALPGFVPSAVKIGQAIAAELAQVGITVNITVATTFPEYAKDGRSGAFSAVIYPSPGLTGMSNSYSVLYSPAGVINPQAITLPDVDASADAAAAASTDASQAAWAATNKIAVDQAYSVPITSDPTIIFHDTKVNNVAVFGIINPVYITPAS